MNLFLHCWQGLHCFRKYLSTKLDTDIRIRIVVIVIRIREDESGKHNAGNTQPFLNKLKPRYEDQ